MQEPVKSTALHNPSAHPYYGAGISCYYKRAPSIGVPSDDVICQILDMKHLEDLIRN